MIVLLFRSAEETLLYCAQSVSALGLLPNLYHTEALDQNLSGQQNTFK